MWLEPLTADTTVIDPYTVLVRTRQGDGTPVARVLALHNDDAHYAVFGEMQISDPSGGSSQRVRALVLLVREALRYAAAIGITRAHTDAPPRMAGFAARLSGAAGELRGEAIRFEGEIYAMRSAALNASDDAGNLIGGSIANV